MHNIPKLVDSYMEEKIRIYPCHANRASDIGDDCERRLVYKRTRWEEQKPHGVGLQYIFEEGNEQERRVVETLSRVGVDVIKRQQDFQWKEYNITGHIDGVIILDDLPYIVDIKTMSPYIYNGVHSMKDLNKYPWTRKYASQLQVYMLGLNIPRSFLLIKNKTSGQLKQLPKPLDGEEYKGYELDYELAESLIERAERINKHVADGTLPDFVKDTSICQECPFVHICNPRVEYGEELQVVNDGELIEMLDKRGELMKAKREYEKLDAEIKNRLNGAPNVMAGDWHITTNEYERKFYNVPKDIKDEYEEVRTYSRFKIQNFGDLQDD